MNRVIIMREAITKIVRMLAEKNVQVTQCGSSAFVTYDRHGEPERVNIPYIPDDASEEMLDATQGFIDHEVGHILHSDFGVLAQAKRERVARLHNVIEDAYIEKKQARMFPGSAHNLSNVGRFFLKSFTDVQLREKPKAAEGLLMVPAIRAWSGQVVYQDYMADKWHLLERVTKRIEDLIPEFARVNSSADGLALALKVKERLEKPTPKKDEGPKKGEKGSPGRGGAAGVVAGEDAPEPAPGKKGKGAKPEPGAAKPEESKPEGGAAAKGEATIDEELEGVEDELDGKDAPASAKPEEPTVSHKPEPEADDDLSAEASGVGAGDDPGEEIDPVDRDGDEPAEEDDAPLDIEGGEAAGDGLPDDDDGARHEDEHRLSAREPAKKEDEGAGAEEGEPPEIEARDCDEDYEGELDDSESEEVAKGRGAGSGGGRPGEDGSAVPAEDRGVYGAVVESMPDDFEGEVGKLIGERAVEEAKRSEYLIYTRDFDKVGILDVKEASRFWNDGLLKALADDVDHMVGPLQKDMERAVAARSLAMFSAGHRSGRLHTSGLARLALGDERVFRRKHVSHSKDVAIGVLIDASGSMGGARIHVASRVGFAVSSVLDRMNIAHEVMAFTTEGEIPGAADVIREEERKIGKRYARTENIWMPILKGFNERVNVEVKKRFAWLPVGVRLRENVDGECVQIAAARLAMRRESRRILMVLSDGAPACPGDWDAQHAHLKRAVRDLARSRIECIGIGIQTDAVRGYYPKFVVIHSLEELPDTVMKQIKRILMQN